MRVAIIAESFLPQINGVTNSVLRVLEHLRATGHEAMVICSDHPDGVPEHYLGYPIVKLPSRVLYWYQSMRFTIASTTTLATLLTNFAPDVVHLASPFILGYRSAIVTAKLGLPCVAVYQTDVPGYIGLYGFTQAETAAWRRVRRIHNLATMTLAPSTFTQKELTDQGIVRVKVWGRGVDSRRFSPTKRDEALHHLWAPDGEQVIGYMGRLGAEKRVADLAHLANLPNTRLVIIGDGPQKSELEALLPDAIFTGQKLGDELPRYLASVDLFIHTGELDTFGQTIQEAQASGLPVVAPSQGGPIDLIEPARTGWLYPPGDLDAMHSYLAQLTNDDSMRAEFGRAARAVAEQRTWPAICAQLVEHYREAIQLGSNPTRQVLAG